MLSKGKTIISTYYCLVTLSGGSTLAFYMVQNQFHKADIELEILGWMPYKVREAFTLC